MGESRALPWQDEPEDMDILSGVEELPIWGPSASLGGRSDAGEETAPSLPPNFPTLSSREADALLGILPSRSGDLSDQPPALQASIPGLFSVPSTILRDAQMAEGGDLGPATSSGFAVETSQQLAESSQAARNDMADPAFGYLGSQSLEGQQLHFPVSHSWDAGQDLGRRGIELQPIRSTVSWHEPMPEIAAEGGSRRQLRGAGRLTSSAPHVASHAVRTILQFPPQQEPGMGMPIRIRVPAPESEKPEYTDHPARATSIDASYLTTSPFDVPTSAFGQLATGTDTTSGLSIPESSQMLSRGSAPNPTPRQEFSGPKYRVRSNALPRKRSVSETRLTEFTEDTKQPQLPFRGTQSGEGMERQAASTTSSEPGFKPSSAADSEDSSGPASMAKAEERAREAAAAQQVAAAGPQLVSIHPDKLARFLLQLQTIQAKVNSLQAEREAAAEKVVTLEKGSSMLSSLVEEMEGLESGGATVDEREARLRTTVSQLKELLGATDLRSLVSTDPAVAPGSSRVPAAASADEAGPSTMPASTSSKEEASVPATSEMDV